jgi:hypothetical protein
MPPVQSLSFLPELAWTLLCLALGALAAWAATVLLWRERPTPLAASVAALTALTVFLLADSIWARQAHAAHSAIAPAPIPRQILLSAARHPLPIATFLAALAACLLRRLRRTRSA